MSRSEAFRVAGAIRWALFALISVLLHGAIALSSWSATGSPRHASVAGATPIVNRIQPRVTLGESGSTGPRMTWIGYRTPTPHEATQSTVDQAASDRGNATSPSLATPLPAPASPSSPPSTPPPQHESVPTPQTQEQLREALARVEHASEQVQAAADHAAQQAIQAVARAAEGVVRSLPETPAPAHIENTGPSLPEPDAPLDEQATPGAVAPPTLRKPEPSRSQLRPDSPSPQPAAGSADAQSPSPEPAQSKGDRDSAATSRLPTLRIRPGKPWAGEGLRVETVRPDFAHITRILSRPKNPLIRVFIDAQGKVTDATVLESAGASEVDQPVLNAIYQWRFSGESLPNLVAQSGKETVSVDIRMVLGSR